MPIANFIARQLRKPSGWWGKVIMSRLLNAGNAAMNEFTLQQLDLSTDPAIAPTETILEVGFGGGYLLGKILDRPVVKFAAGIDFSPEMVELAKKRFSTAIAAEKLELQCASVENIPYANTSFTKICTVNTIYFWADLEKALAELERVLIREGTLSICFNSPAFLEQQGFTRRGFLAYDINFVKNLLVALNFKNITAISQQDTLREEFTYISAQK